MIIATYFKVFKWNTPFTKGQDAGYEFDLLIIAGLIAIFLLGSGILSLDQGINLECAPKMRH